MSKRNHYEELGLDLSAPPSAIAAAIQHLAERADALAYSSPERSQQMWDYIREIKRDLLSGPEARAEYVRRLREAPVAGGDTSPTAATTPPGPHTPPIHWPVVFGAALTVLAALIVAAVIRYPHGSPHPAQQPVALVPETSGPHRDDAYLSGRRVVLTWNAVPHAILYRIQIASTRPGAPAAQVFTHPKVTWLTTATRYSIKVTGAEQYYWRVQPNVGGVWRRFSVTQRFLVARPAVGTPRPLYPADNTALTTGHVRLCWRGVPGAAAYRLSLSRSTRRTVHGTCARNSVAPGAYAWTVSALVRGVALYAGAPSPAYHFVVLEPVLRPSTRQIAARGPTTGVPARRVSRPLRHSTSHAPRPTTARSTRPASSHHPFHASPVSIPTRGPQPIRVARRRLSPAPHARTSPARAAPAAPPTVAMLPPAPPPRTARPGAVPSPPRGHRPAQPAWGRPRSAATVTARGGVVPTVRPAARPPLPPSPRPTTAPPPAPPAVVAGAPPAPTAAPTQLLSRPAAVYHPAPSPASPYAYRASHAAPASRPTVVPPPTTPTGPGASVPVGPLRRP